MVNFFLKEKILKANNKSFKYIEKGEGNLVLLVHGWPENCNSTINRCLSTFASGPIDDNAWESSLAQESTIASSAEAVSPIVGFWIWRDIVLWVEPRTAAISVWDHPFPRKSLATCWCYLSSHLPPTSPSINSLTYALVIQYYT